MSVTAADNPSVMESSGLSRAAIESIDRRAREIGGQLYRRLPRQRPWVFQRRFWDDRLLDWSMKDEALKVQLFRFVDVLPMLHDREAVAGHLAEYLGDVRDRLPWLARAGLSLGQSTRISRGLLSRMARMGASDFAKKFIAGTNAKEVLAAARHERSLGRAFTLDILGEAVTSRAEADQFFQSYQELLQAVAPTVNEWPEDRRLDHDHLGPIPRSNLSVKLSALDCHFDPIDPAGVTRRVGDRLKELLRLARQHKAFINVDMESYEKKDLTLHIFEDVLMDPEFRDFADVGIVLQCYLRDSGADFVRLRDWAARRGTPIWVRLVKGAYWDYETVHAQAEGWPIPVYQEKWQSDANFERQTRYALANIDHLRPALGSHNLRSLAHGIACAEHLDLPDGASEIQMLYGMADAEKRSLVDRGLRMRVYMPYGQLIPGMAYLVRRLLENTSNDSFLRQGLANRVGVDELMADPVARSGESTNGRTTTASADRKADDDMSMRAERPNLRATFRNEPPIDFAIEKNRHLMQQALLDVGQMLGREYPLVIGDDRIQTGDWIDSVNPSRFKQVVGRVASAGSDHVEQAVAAAREAFQDWSVMDAEERATFLRSVAHQMRKRRFELAAWIVLESGKPWRESTNDVCEAIDFCEFYAAEAIRLQAEDGADVPGEENRFEYLPRGVAAVISPWNFPLAILTGMTAAALATGNTVIMKPAEQSPVIAALLMEMFVHAETPPGVINFLPGTGEVAGAGLVAHPDVSLIAFTGSRQVGLAINAKAAEVSASGIPFVKKVIAEMGGKNAIIIDDDADLDEAVLGVASSAFGFQGQKCSACSRVIVLESTYDVFVERLVEAARSMVVGPSSDPSTQVGPVIDADSVARIRRFIEIAREEGRERLAVDVGPLAEAGYFVGPHIFDEIAPAARIAQEEVFGPILAVLKVKDLDEAFRVANGTDYALTGGIFSRSPRVLDRARREMQVGNLYLNRSITGALVGRQPFGGFKMSGIGSKAGGRDYLLQFLLPRTVTENTMRRGFAPPAD